MTQYSGKIIRKNPVTPTQQSASGVWTTADAAAAVKNNNWPVAGVPNPISRSVRLRNSASAYLNRTPASASDRRTWTYSGWVKRGLLNTRMPLMGGYTGTTNGTLRTDITILDGAALNVGSDQMQTATDFVLQTTQLFRDPSAWYHIVVAMDTTQATSTNRVKIYVNGVQVTAFSTATYPSLNYQGGINFTNNQYINRWFDSSGGNYYGDGYMTEVNFIDGQALTPSSFGTTDSTTGAWIPMPYTGTYGTNGFYLNFKDNTSTTTIGYDYSGNSNNWTANNISLTAGVTYDSMVDVPTLWMPYNTAGDTGALVRGNYATWNPLWRLGGSGYITPTNGNLRASIGSTNNIIASTIQLPSSGKWYMELTLTTGVYAEYGLCNSTASGGGTNGGVFGSYYNGVNQYAIGPGVISDGNQAWVTGDVGLIAVDVSNNKLWIGRIRSGTTVWMGGGNPSSGTSPSFSASGGGGVYATTFDAQTFNNPFVASGGGADVWDANFGQQPFIGTPPTGFKTLNTFNLPAPTINNGASYMAATTYTGTGSALTIANTVGSASFQPDLVWVKGRSGATDHAWYDAVRGVQLQLESNTTTAETTETTGLTAFGSTGFTVGALAQMNTNTATYVAWQWNAGGSTVTNTSGSISSQVRASTTAAFSVVTYTGTGANATVGHGLGVALKMVIVKRRDSGPSSWTVWHSSFSSIEYIYLNLTNAKSSSSGATVWNSALPTSSVFSLGTYTDVNASAGTYVAYCFAAVAGYSAFGSYTGNGSTDGPFVFLGFRPRFCLIKRTDSTGNWFIWDSSRNTSNTVNNQLYPDSSSAEQVQDGIDFLSNGFKIRFSSTFADRNANGGTYIYAAFAENPFKYSNAR